MEPLFVVECVSKHSPSHSAGLKSGDLILKFGSMSAVNHSKQSMQDILRQSAGEEIAVIIKRNQGEYHTLRLMLQKWNGKGKFGCRLIPFAESMAECKGNANPCGSVI